MYNLVYFHIDFACSTNIKITLQSKRWLVQEQETGLDGSFTTPCVTWHQDHQPQLGLDLRVQHLHGGTTCQPAQRQAVQQCGPRPRGPEPLHWGPPVLPQSRQVKHLSTVSSSQTVSREQVNQRALETFWSMNFNSVHFGAPTTLYTLWGKFRRFFYQCQKVFFN